MYYVYIIYSQTIRQFYTGRTDDLKERITRHNTGRSVFTKNGSSWILAHYQAFCEKEDAAREELFLKTGKGRERKKFLLKSFIEKQK
jgi:putative endonuclease